MSLKQIATDNKLLFFTGGLEEVFDTAATTRNWEYKPALPCSFPYHRLTCLKLSGFQLVLKMGNMQNHGLGEC